MILALFLVSASAGGEVEIRYEGVQHDARGVWLVHRSEVACVCVWIGHSCSFSCSYRHCHSAGGSVADTVSFTYVSGWLDWLTS